MIKICYFGYNLGFFLTRFRYFVVKMGIVGETCVSVCQVLGYFLLELGSFSQELGIFGKNLVDFGNKWVFLL